MSSTAAPVVDAGESSNDECCMCGQEYIEGQSKGWVLCDSTNCPNTVCSSCTSNLGLIVSDLFYCPPCSGSGQSAAATVGGAVATAVAACSELENLPLSFKAVRKILGNLRKTPDEAKYRKLRLENPAVRKYVDLDPVLRILTSVGFVRKEEVRTNAEGEAPPVEQVLVLDGSVDIGQINELIEILDGLSSPNDEQDVQKVDEKSDEKDASNKTDAPVENKDKPEAKRSPTSATDIGAPDAKKKRKEEY